MNPLEGVRKNMSIGIAGSGYSVKLTNAYGKTVSDGEIGQITVKGKKGKTLMLGYYKDEEATKKTLKNDWLYTEDNAKILEDGYFYFVDRMKDMVKRAGENIATSEVESVLNEHPKIADSAVIGIKDEIRDVSLKALVVLKDGEKLTKEEVIDYCRSNIAKFKVPEFIEFLEEFPRTSVGKIQKAKLRDNGRIRN
jgi:crotonobetaine/carnitine-CoA ligase